MHVVSRTAGQEILFGDAEKETFSKILFKQLKFSGLRVLAWRFMGNPFHLLLEIPDREVALGALSDDDVLARLDVFRDEQSTRLLLGELEMCRKNGNVARVCADRGAGVGAAVRPFGVHEGAETQGERRFVDEFFERQREYFGERRKSGGRKMKGADWGELRVLRDLKDDVVTPPG